MEEIGDRTTVFEFGGLRDQQQGYIAWALGECLAEGVQIADVVTDDAIAKLAAKLKTPLQIGRHLVRAFEAGFEAGVKPIDATVVEGVLSARIDDLEPQLTRHGYARKLVRIWPKLVRMVGQKLQASENDSTFPAVDPRPAVRYAIHYH